MPGLIVVVVEEYHVGEVLIVVDYVGKVDHRFVAFVHWHGVGR